ncbi:hypothetical protein N9L68_01860 [bacterium]|nr:hypothetical protein [bacterium]
MWQIWEEANAKAKEFNLKGRRAVTDGPWRRAVKRGIGRAKGRESITTIQDQRKCYDNVSHAVFIREGFAMKAPMSLLRLSIAQYKWGRSLVVARTYAKPLCGKRGIIAGATSATYDINLYMYRTVARQN